MPEEWGKKRIIFRSHLGRTVRARSSPPAGVTFSLEEFRSTKVMVGQSGPGVGQRSQTLDKSPRQGQQKPATDPSYRHLPCPVVLQGS